MGITTTTIVAKKESMEEFIRTDGLLITNSKTSTASDPLRSKIERASIRPP